MKRVHYFKPIKDGHGMMAVKMASVFILPQFYFMANKIRIRRVTEL